MMMVLGNYLSSQIDVFKNVWSHRCRNKKTVTTVEYLLCCFLRLFLNRKVSLTFSVSNTMKLLTEKYSIFHLQAELPKADLLIQSDFISLLF